MYTVYIRNFGIEITESTIIYGAYIYGSYIYGAYIYIYIYIYTVHVYTRFWPTVVTHKKGSHAVVPVLV
jgi:hypothetical protein